MRFLAGLLFLLLITAADPHTLYRGTTLWLSPVTLDPDHPARRRFDSLELLGAWRLTSDNRRFGGISAMIVRDGHFLLLSDSARAFRFSLVPGQSRTQFRDHRLPATVWREHGRPKPDRDSESMTMDPRTGRVWVSFEASNAIRRFAPGLGLYEGMVAPPASRKWPVNGGGEALVRLADGRFLLFGEDPPGPVGSRQAVLFSGDPLEGGAATRFYYRPPAGFAPTDAAALPDGRLLILNRHFSPLDGISAMLTMIDGRAIRPGVVVQPVIVARLVPPLVIDNFEALAVERAKGGKVVVWILSDDNFNPLQQTLLLKFALDPAQVREARSQ